MFKVPISTSVSTNLNCYTGDPNLKTSHAYALISDGGTGYYATGLIETNAVKTGLQFVHYSSTLSPSWEIAPFGWGSDFDDAIYYLSLSSGYLWGCGFCSDCGDNDNKAVFTRLKAVSSATPSNTDLESIIFKPKNTILLRQDIISMQEYISRVRQE